MAPPVSPQATRELSSDFEGRFRCCAKQHEFGLDMLEGRILTKGHHHGCKHWCDTCFVIEEGKGEKRFHEWVKDKEQDRIIQENRTVALRDNKSDDSRKQEQSVQAST